MVHFIKFQMNPKFQVIEEILISTFQSDFHSQGYLEDSSGHLAVWEELLLIQSNVNWTFWGKVAWCWEIWWQRQVQSKWTPMIIMCRQQSHSQLIFFLGKLCGFGGQQIRQSPHLSIRAVIWTSPSDSWIGRRQSCLRRMVQSNIGPSDIFGQNDCLQSLSIFVPVCCRSFSLYIS